MATDEDIIALQRRLRAAAAERDELIIRREERNSETKERLADHDELRALMYRTGREHERVTGDLPDDLPGAEPSTDSP